MYYGTKADMARLDALSVKHGLQIRQMMELAGWHIIPLFKRLRIKKGAKISIVVGKGNKGGDGLSAARHIVNHGWHVSVILLSRAISADAKHHLKLLEKMAESSARLTILPYSKSEARIVKTLNSSSIIIDALIGYNLQGPPRGAFKEAIELINKSKKRVISYDLPSGISPTSGKCHNPCIRANTTLTLAMPKRAFTNKEARAHSGRIYVADIGIPAFLYDKIKKGSRPPFEKSKDSIATI